MDRPSTKGPASLSWALRARTLWWKYDIVKLHQRTLKFSIQTLKQQTLKNILSDLGQSVETLETLQTFNMAYFCSNPNHRPWESARVWDAI